MVYVRLLRPITHDWGHRGTGDIVPVTQEVAEEWERRGLATISLDLVQSEDLVERVKSNIKKVVEPEKKPAPPRRRRSRRKK